MQQLARAFEAAKRSGRPTARFSLALDLEAILGLPARHGCTAVLVQLMRGQKQLSSEEIEIPREERGAPQVRWPSGCRLEFALTLYKSRSGKPYSDKLFRILLLGVKPTFGTTKKVFKELASSTLNAADWVTASSPQPHSLQLQSRATGGGAGNVLALRPSHPIHKRATRQAACTHHARHHSSCAPTPQDDNCLHVSRRFL
jgi:hypothetical protein